IAKWFKTPANILVVGSSGVGKTQFIQVLRNDSATTNPLRTTKPEKHTTEIEKIKLVLTDTPGHEHYETILQGTIAANVTPNMIKDNIFWEHPLAGIINVVAYGYPEEPNINAKHLLLQGSFDEQLQKVNIGFLERNRNMELEHLNYWLPTIAENSSKVPWIINLINKADIWWDDENDVRQYYDTIFSEPFKHLRKDIEIMNIYFCNKVQPYYNKQRSSMFGEQEKLHLQENFKNKLVSLLSK
ncbi:MAG TPA: 50S ribosome-binding GTPase, partial [Chitinophagales bacterium]|nr:50S ribosome-binding GTPase [Chitinophagales bacterium]